jgi:hypothetical protein
MADDDDDGQGLPLLVPVDHDPFEAAAARVRNAVQPPGGRQEGVATDIVTKFIPTALGGAVRNFMAGPALMADVAHGDVDPTSEEGIQRAAGVAMSNVGRAFPGRGATLGSGAVLPEKPPITAYHGSPHDFDSFDVSKVGTGEGAQAYGHGLYFAENEEVAAGYRSSLSAGNPHSPEDVASNYLRSMSTREAAVEALRDNANKFAHGDASTPEVLHKAADLLESGATPKMPGHTYQVGIKADPESFLDWDKPLSEQPHVPKDVVNKVADLLDRDPRGITGQDLVRTLSHRADQMAATQQLREAGIPGIKYLDQGSRGKGDGTSNYVVFDDKLISIMKKYGIAGIAALPAMGAHHFQTKQVDSDPFAQGALPANPNDSGDSQADAYDQMEANLRTNPQVDPSMDFARKGINVPVRMDLLTEPSNNIARASSGAPQTLERIAGTPLNKDIGLEDITKRAHEALLRTYGRKRVAEIKQEDFHAAVAAALRNANR